MFIAHTSGWPSGTVRSEASTASRSSGVLLERHHGVDGGDADVAAFARRSTVWSIQSSVRS